MTIEDEKANLDKNKYIELPLEDSEINDTKIKGNIEIRKQNYNSSKNIMNSATLALDNDNKIANNIYKNRILTLTEETRGDLKQYNNESGYVTEDGYWRLLDMKRISSYRWNDGKRPEIIKLNAKYYNVGDMVDGKIGKKISIMFPTIYIKAQNRRSESKLYIGSSLVPYKISDLYNKNVLISKSVDLKNIGGRFIGCAEDSKQMLRHENLGKTKNLKECKELADNLGHAFYSLSNTDSRGRGTCLTGNTFNNFRPNSQNFKGEEKFNIATNNRQFGNNYFGRDEGGIPMGCYKDRPGREMQWLGQGRWFTWEQCRDAALKIPGAKYFALQYAVNNQKGQCFYSRENDLTGRLSREGKRLTNGRAPWVNSCHGYSCGGKNGYVCPPGKPGSVGRWWCCSQGRWVSNLNHCRRNNDNCFYNRTSKSGWRVHHGNGWSNYIYKIDPKKYKCQPYNKNDSDRGIIGKIIWWWWGGRDKETIYKGKKVNGKNYNAIYMNPTTWWGAYKRDVGKSGYVDKTGKFYDTTKYQKLYSSYSLNTSQVPWTNNNNKKSYVKDAGFMSPDKCKALCDKNANCSGYVITTENNKKKCLIANKKAYNNVTEQGVKSSSQAIKSLNPQWYQRDIIVNTGNPNCSNSNVNIGHYSTKTVETTGVLGKSKCQDPSLPYSAFDGLACFAHKNWKERLRKTRGNPPCNSYCVNGPIGSTSCWNWCNYEKLDNRAGGAILVRSNPSCYGRAGGIYKTLYEAIKACDKNDKCVQIQKQGNLCGLGNYELRGEGNDVKWNGMTLFKKKKHKNIELTGSIKSTVTTKTGDYTMLENNKINNLQFGGDIKKLDCTNKEFINKIKRVNSQANNINKQQYVTGERDVKIMDNSIEKINVKIESGNNLGESGAVSTDKNAEALKKIKGKQESFIVKEGYGNQYELIDELTSKGDNRYFNNIMKLIGNDNKILDVKHKGELSALWTNRHSGFDEKKRYHQYFIIKYKKGRYPIPFAKLPDGTPVWYYSSYRTKGEVTNALKKITDQLFFEDSIKRIKKNVLFTKANVGEVSYVNYNPTGNLTNEIAKQNYWLTNGYKSVMNSQGSNIPTMPIFSNSENVKIIKETGLFKIVAFKQKFIVDWNKTPDKNAIKRPAKVIYVEEAPGGIVLLDNGYSFKNKSTSDLDLKSNDTLFAMLNNSKYTLNSNKFFTPIMGTVSIGVLMLLLFIYMKNKK